MIRLLFACAHQKEHGVGNYYCKPKIHNVFRGYKILMKQVALCFALKLAKARVCSFHPSNL